LRGLVVALAGAGAILVLVPAAALAAPTILGESVWAVTPHSALLEAVIEDQAAPSGALYQFQIVSNPSEYQSGFVCPPEWEHTSLCQLLPEHGEHSGTLPLNRTLAGYPYQQVGVAPAGAKDFGNLTPNTTYHYRVIAANYVPEENFFNWEPPIVFGPDETFTTPAATQPRPTMSSIAPNRGPASGGSEVTIKGTNLGGASGVKFGNAGHATSFTVKSETEIVAVSPPTRGENVAEVQISTPGGVTPENAEVDSFFYEPTVSKIEPSSGPAAGGTSVTITGTDFEGEFTGFESELIEGNPVKAVEFGGQPAASFKVESATKITAVSPPGAGEANVVVSIGGALGKGEVIHSEITPADRFTYESPPPPPPTICQKEEQAGKLPPETVFCTSEQYPGVSGSLGFRKLNQSVEVKEGTFTGLVAFQGFEPIRGVVHGVATVKPFEATIKLLGVSAKVGVTFEEVRGLNGSLTEAGRGTGNCVAEPEELCVHESLPLEVNMGFTSLTLAGLKIPLECKTARPVSLPLSENVMLFGEFLDAGSHFTGTTTYPRISCRGPVGVVEGAILSALVSGPGNSYSLVIT
jgi:IPT/TIG domain